MVYGICTLAAVPVRAQASHKSEMTSQLLFGESIEVLDQQEEWTFVRMAYDQYEGWISHKQWTEISPDYYEGLQTRPQTVTGLSLHSMCLKVGKEEIVNVLPGSTLPFFQEQQFQIGEQSYLFIGEEGIPESGDFLQNLEETAQYYLNAPYLWGGRSLFGMDCSGFVQIVFKHLGIGLARDAKDQATQGTLVSFEEANPGDLAFFENPDGQITHVGLLLPDGDFIHASGQVRVDELDAQGIKCRSTGVYSHQLHSVRRFI